MIKDYRAMLAPFLASGYVVEQTRNKHYVVLDPSGKRVTTLSGTPSDRRALLNARAQIRRSARR